MVLPKFKAQISVEEYLELEKYSPVKHEYVYGELYAMDRATDNHNRIVVEILTLLNLHLRGSRC